MMSSKLIRRCVLFVGVSIGSELLYQAFIYLKGRKSRTKQQGILLERDNVEDEETRSRNIRKPPDLWNTVLFFPDASNNDPESPIAQLLAYIDAGKMIIRICMFLASYPPFEKIILQKKRDGLCIQVVTDIDTLRAHNNFSCQRFSQQGETPYFGWRLACQWSHKHGITVRTRNTGHLMHNKFIIIDDEALITGSMNFTKQAMQGNSENVVVTTNPSIVRQYKVEFSRLFNEGEDFDR